MNEFKQKVLERVAVAEDVNLQYDSYAGLHPVEVIQVTPQGNITKTIFKEKGRP